MINRPRNSHGLYEPTFMGKLMSYWQILYDTLEEAGVTDLTALRDKLDVGQKRVEVRDSVNHKRVLGHLVVERKTLKRGNFFRMVADRRFFVTAYQTERDFPERLDLAVADFHIHRDFLSTSTPLDVLTNVKGFEPLGNSNPDF